jgi:predicted DNA-binding transcriptional regulator YafY
MPDDTIYQSVELEVTRFKYDGEEAFFDITDSDDDTARLYANEAVPVAQAILKSEGVAQDAVLASEVSFNEALFRLAAAHDKEVTFRYAKGKDGKVIETRVLKPEQVKEVGGHLTFVGFDPDRDDVRAYRLDRVKGEVTIR